MENRVIFSCAMLLFAALSTSVTAATLGEVSQNQQNMIMLKSALERAKLEKELSDMNAVKVSAADVCVSKGIGSLGIKSIYGVNNNLTAVFTYNSASMIEAQVGETLLCGEKVQRITLDRVVVEKDNIAYNVTGNIASEAGR